MSRLLMRAGHQHRRLHPWQAVLLVVGVALGVAVVIGVDLANASALRAFGLSMDSISGRATHQIVAGQAGVDEALYAELKRSNAPGAFAPVLVGQVAIEGGRSIPLLGLDPFADAAFRSHLAQGFQSGDASLLDFLTRSDTTVLTAMTAERLQLDIGETLRARIDTRWEALSIVGTIRPSTERETEALGDLVLVDIATAQELLGMQGRLSHIDWIAPEGATLDAWLPDGVRVQPAAGRTQAMASMTEAFRLNLTALSLLAMVVGMFLIYNAMTFSVVQRRETIGILRAIGVSRRDVQVAILKEALMLGVLGSVLGLALGVALGTGLTRLVTTTINDLYFALSVRDVSLAPIGMVKGCLLGILTTCFAAWLPAREAASIPPQTALKRSNVESSWRRTARRGGWVGTGMVFFGVLAIGLAERSLALSFAGVFALLLGCALWTPGLTIVAMRLLQPLAQRVAGRFGKMAAGGVRSALSRTGIAIAALMVAVSVTVGIGIMIDSFRRTVVDWLSESLIADVYVSPPDMTVGNGRVRLEPDLLEALRAVPGARQEATVRRADVPRADGGATVIVAIGADDSTKPVYDLVDGSFEQIWSAFMAGDGVLVSEPYARRFDVGAGGTVELLTDRGERAFDVLGVYRDFSSDQGIVAMHWNGYIRHWDDRALSGIAFFLEPSTKIDDFIDALALAAGEGREIQIRSNRAIREEAITIFNRTFTITSVLRFLAVIVAIVGILSALMAFQLERTREFGILRAIGLTPRELLRLVTLQTSMIGLTAGVLAVPVGLALAWIMIRVINLRAFGWTLEMSVRPALLLQAIVIAVVAAIVAGIYPALRLSRVSPAVALKESP